MALRRVRAGLRELRPLLLLLLLLGPWPAAGHGGKYSREKNEPAPPSKREPTGEFRIEKLNQLWEKAQRLNLSPVRLSELHADLKIQERDEFKWKKMKSEGLDEDGEKEAKLRRSLSVILAKYGLDGRKDTLSTNFLNHGPEDDSLEDPGWRSCGTGRGRLGSSPAKNWTSCGGSSCITRRRSANTTSCWRP